MSLNIVLYQPEIPQNTGNIARTCVVTGAALHLIGPMGFSIDDKQVRRAGLDYWNLLDLKYYQNFDAFLKENNFPDLYCMTTKATKHYHHVTYIDPCYLLFGRETAGLPEEIRKRYQDTCIRLPMHENPKARSLNLSNAVAIITYEVLRQWEFPDMK